MVMISEMDYQRALVTIRKLVSPLKEPCDQWFAMSVSLVRRGFQTAPDKCQTLFETKSCKSQKTWSRCTSKTSSRNILTPHSNNTLFVCLSWPLWNATSHSVVGQNLATLRNTQIEPFRKDKNKRLAPQLPQNPDEKKHFRSPLQKL